MTDEIDDHALSLAGVLAQSPTQLLQKKRRAIGGPQHQQGINRGHIHTLVEDVHREDDPQIAAGQPAQSVLPHLCGRLTGDGHSSNAVIVEHARHEVRVTHRHAEPECSHGVNTADLVLKGANHSPRPCIVGGEHIAERLQVVAPTTPPGHLPQVGSIRNTIVGKRHQTLVIDRIPQSQFCGYSPVEPDSHRIPVGSLRSGCQTQQFSRLQVFQKGPIGWCCRVVKLVDANIDLTEMTLLDDLDMINLLFAESYNSPIFDKLMSRLVKGEPNDFFINNFMLDLNGMIKNDFIEKYNKNILSLHSDKVSYLIISLIVRLIEITN